MWNDELARCRIGAALVGNQVQKKHDQPVPAQHIIARVKSGVLVSITQSVDARLNDSQKVYSEGCGGGARVVPQ
jgi:outer membrane lipoprotein SlyB